MQSETGSGLAPEPVLPVRVAAGHAGKAPRIGRALAEENLAAGVTIPGVPVAAGDDGFLAWLRRGG
jgi:uncharacterized protein involved in tolerance to divalent cations